jgi:hypothetical protein
MARKNKRQRKKQLIQELDQLGIKDTKAAARIASNKSTYNQIHNFFNRDDIKDLKPQQKEKLKPLLTGDPKKLKKKIYQYNYDNQRKAIRDERRGFLKSIGVKDGALLKRLSESKPEFEKYKHDYEEEEARRNQLHMVIFWRDKTQEKRHGRNVIEQKNSLKYLSNEMIIDHIQTVMDDPKLWSQHGEIEIKLTKDPQSLIKLYTGRTLLYGTSEEKKIKEQEWELVYLGTAQRKRQILIAIGGIIQILYKEYKKEAVGDIIRNLLAMPDPKAQKIGKEIAAALNFRKYEENQRSLFSTNKKKNRRK